MKRFKRNSARSNVIEDRSEWLDQMCRNQAAEPALLISGLRHDDTQRWEIGVLDAAVETKDGRPVIRFTLAKPKDRRASGEREFTDRWLDPEAFYTMQVILAFGGSVGLILSKSHHMGIPYHYLRVKFSSQAGMDFRYQRMIANGEEGHLVTFLSADFRDVRRCNLCSTLSTSQASARYGSQNGSRNLTRQHLLLAAASTFEGGSQWFSSRAEYLTAIETGFALLDALTACMTPETEH